MSRNDPAVQKFAMATLESKPLLAKSDLPLDKIAEICRRWKIHEMAVDTCQTRPASYKGAWVEPDRLLTRTCT